MMAIRYGTLPLVHKLEAAQRYCSTVQLIEGTGTGFSFDNLTPYWLNRAHKLPWMFTIIIRCLEKSSKVQEAMECDFLGYSLSVSYLDLYHSLAN